MPRCTPRPSSPAVADARTLPTSLPERQAHGEERPGDGVDQERGVAEGVEEQGGVAGRYPGPRLIATGPRAHHDQCREEDDRCVRQQPEHPLFGSDRDRLGVRDRLLDPVDLAPEAHRECAGPPSRDRPLLEEVDPARDQPGTATGGLAQIVALALDRVVVGNADQRHRGDGDDHQRAGDRRAAEPEADPEQQAEPGDQRGEARLGERDREGRQEEGGQERAGDRLALRTVPGDPGPKGDHREGQIAPEDVGVAEDGVDPEVEMQLIRFLELLVQQQVTGQVLPERDPREHQADHDERGGYLGDELAVPAHVAQQHEQRGEGRQEEGHVHDRVPRVLRPGDREGVCDQRGR